MRRIPAAAAVMLLSIFLCASVFAADSPPVTQSPDWKVGDEWRYVGGEKWLIRVVAREGDTVTTECIPCPRCPGCRDMRDPNWAIFRVLDKDGQPIPNCEVCGARAVDFPLSVGKEWQSEFRSWSSGGGRSDYVNYYRIVAFEEVKTKAGTFKAYRINMRQDNAGPYRGSWQLDLWWSPEVRGFVKRRVYAPGWVSDYELEAFSLK
jgi:hypothetical protein